MGSHFAITTINDSFGEKHHFDTTAEKEMQTNTQKIDTHIDRKSNSNN